MLLLPPVLVLLLGALLLLPVLLLLLLLSALLLLFVLVLLLSALLLLLVLVLLLGPLMLLLFVLVLLLSALLVLLILVLLLFLFCGRVLLLLFRLSLLTLFRGLSLLLLLLLCVRGSYGCEKQQQNSHADKSNRFHKSCLHYVYFLRPLALSGRCCATEPYLSGLVPRRLLVQSGNEQFRRGGRVNRTIDYDFLRADAFSVDPPVAIAVGAKS